MVQATPHPDHCKPSVPEYLFIYITEIYATERMRLLTDMNSRLHIFRSDERLLGTRVIASEYGQALR